MVLVLEAERLWLLFERRSLRVFGAVHQRPRHVCCLQGRNLRHAAIKALRHPISHALLSRYPELVRRLDRNMRRLLSHRLGRIVPVGSETG